MTDLEVMQRAKMYIDKLANGVNPITDQSVSDSDCINNVLFLILFSKHLI